MKDLISREKIKQGCDNAYKIAKENAYFGEGFYMGVQFALKESKSPEMYEALKEDYDVLLSVLQYSKDAKLVIKAVNRMEKIEQLIKELEQ